MIIKEIHKIVSGKRLRIIKKRMRGAKNTGKTLNRQTASGGAEPSGCLPETQNCQTVYIND